MTLGYYLAKVSATFGECPLKLVANRDSSTRSKADSSAGMCFYAAANLDRPVFWHLQPSDRFQPLNQFNSHIS